MRTPDSTQHDLFCYTPLEDLIPRHHPARRLRVMADHVLRAMSPEFERLYSDRGRPCIPPEQVLRALLVQILFSVPSERRLMEDLRYNFLYRWFVGLELADPVWDVTVFTKKPRAVCGGRDRPILLWPGVGTSPSGEAAVR